jgi:hypothetical protein
MLMNSLDDSEEANTPIPPQGRPTVIDLIWLNAFGNFLEALNQTFKQDRTDGRPYQYPSVTERSQYITGLRAVATFVGTFNKPIGARFFELSSKPENLEKGDDDPLFVPVKFSNRREDISRLWRARARMVLAIEALVRTGTRPAEAEKKIAAHLGPKVFGFAGRRAAGTPPKKILKHWRKAFGARRIGDDVAQIIFDEGVARIDELLQAGDRAPVLAIAQNVESDIELGGVLSLSITHR